MEALLDAGQRILLGPQVRCGGGRHRGDVDVGPAGVGDLDDLHQAELVRVRRGSRRLEVDAALQAALARSRDRGVLGDHVDAEHAVGDRHGLGEIALDEGTLARGALEEGSSRGRLAGRADVAWSPGRSRRGRSARLVLPCTTISSVPPANRLASARFPIARCSAVTASVAVGARTPDASDLRRSWWSWSSSCRSQVILPPADICQPATTVRPGARVVSRRRGGGEGGSGCPFGQRDLGRFRAARARFVPCCSPPRRGAGAGRDSDTVRACPLRPRRTGSRSPTTSP